MKEKTNNFKEIMESAKKDHRWIEFLYPEWGWQEAHWNGGAWVPLRMGNPPTDCREILHT